MDEDQQQNESPAPQPQNGSGWDEGRQNDVPEPDAGVQADGDGVAPGDDTDVHGELPGDLDRPAEGEENTPDDKGY